MEPGKYVPVFYPACYHGSVTAVYPQISWYPQHQLNPILSLLRPTDTMSKLRHNDMWLERLQSGLSQQGSTPQVPTAKNLSLTIKGAKSHLSPLDPIHKLPVDLLEHIFLLCQQLSFDDNGFIVICNPFTFTRVATRVCSSWRTTVLNCPFLWSRISVDPYDKRAKSFSSALSMIGPSLLECLARSNEVPLTISFSRTCKPTFFLKNDTVLKGVAKSAKRWRDIRIGWELLEAIDLHIPFADEFLSLHMKSLTILDDVTGHRTLTFASQMPQLSNLTVGSITNPYQRLRFPWSQISNFTSDNNVYTNASDLQVLLNSMRRLASLTFFGFTGRASDTILIPKLRTLTLIGDYQQIVEQLDTFLTPCLTSLNIDCGTSFEGDIYPRILSFLQRSECTIQTLVLQGIPLYDGWNDQELNCITRLDVYRMSDMRFSDDLRWLTRFDESLESLLPFPQLEELWLNFEPDVEIGKAIIEMMHMIQSRLLPTSRKGENENAEEGKLACLRQVDVNFSRELTHEQASTLRNFICSQEVMKVGAKVAIRHGLLVNGRRQEGNVVQTISPVGWEQGTHIQHTSNII